MSHGASGAFGATLLQPKKEVLRTLDRGPVLPTLNLTRLLLLPLCLPRDPSLLQVDVSDGYRQFVEGGGVLLLTATTANLVGEGPYAITRL